MGRPALKDITKDVSNANDLDSLSGTISEQKLLFDIDPGAHNTGMSGKVGDRTVPFPPSVQFELE